MRKIATNDALMTTREAGEALGVAVRTIQLWVESGVLPAWRTAGGHRRIARSAVEKLKSQRRDAISDGVNAADIGLDHPGAHADVLAANATSSPVQPFKMLVVEDDPIQLQLIRIVMEGWDFPHALMTATNGFEGLMRVGQWRPDVIVTDLSMPGMDGFEMLRAIKSPDSGFANVAVVVVSALDDADIAQNGGLPAGVRFYRKPVDFGLLEEYLRALAAQHTVP